MSLVLYHHNSSVCAAKIRIALAEKKLKWDSRLLELNGDQFDPNYLTLNPNAVVPTLVHNKRAVIESTIILEYLDDAFPEHCLRPVDPYYMAQARLLMSKLDAGVASIHYSASVVTYGIAYRHQLIETAGGMDRNRLIAAIDQNMNVKSRRWLQDVVFNGIHSPIFLQALLNFDRLLAEFEGLLSSTKWLSGDSYSISEASFTPYMVRLDLLQLNFLWRDRPHVAAWYERLKKRQSTAAVFNYYYPSSIERLTKYGFESAEEVGAMFKKAQKIVD